MWREIFNRAKKEGWAVGHFNISDSQTLMAVVRAGAALKSPLMIGTSENERAFLGLRQAVFLVEAFRQDFGVPLILNADHHKSFESCKEAIDFGFGSVLFDGSALSFEKNLEVAKQVVEYAKSKNPEILVEAELGYLRGESRVIKEKIEILPDDLTDPDKAEQFVRGTGIDRLAIAVGNSHGISIDEPKLDFERIKAISQKMPANISLVLHGGSGISDEDLKTAIASGISNIHINTEIRKTYTDALRQSLNNTPEEIVPYKIFPPAIEAVSNLVQNKLKVFGSVNKI